MKSNNFLQDNNGNYSMARFAVMMAVIMGTFNGVAIPFVSAVVGTNCMQASLGYYGIAIAGKVTSKLTEGK